jgi:uncharacterized SAM-dependent methyltransferase
MLQQEYTDRLTVLNLMKDSFMERLRADVRIGLFRPQKTIPSKYFYDETGSLLFE